MRDTIVDVGDGACTILRCGTRPERCPVTVLDCGNWFNNGKAAKRLLHVLGPDLARVDTLIVSHFDADHWGGLSLVAVPLKRAGVSHVRLVYAALPAVARAVPSAALALLTTARGTHVRALELRRALQLAGISVTTYPVVAGDTLSTSCRTFRVHWPPATLDADTHVLVTRAITAAEQLADDLSASGYPQLRDNLDEAYGIQLGGGEPVLTDELRGLESGKELPTNETEHEGVHQSLTSQPTLDAVPENLVDRFRAVARLTGRANNDLSMVLGEADGHFAAFGDARASVLRRAAATMRPSYDVSLAPHHGTFAVPIHLPQAKTCVAQAGPHHAARYARHLTTHMPPGRCVSTATIGSVSVL